MLFDLIAAICAGVALAGVAMTLRTLSRGSLPRWLVPAMAGAGMLAYAIWSEYSWFDRTTATLPAGVAVISAPAETMFYRPWSYVRPLHLRFLAVDVARMAPARGNPAIRRVGVLMMARWKPPVQVAVAVDCAGGRLADLTRGAALAADGTLTGTDWQKARADDELMEVACREG